MPTIVNANGTTASVTSNGRLFTLPYEAKIDEVTNGWAFYLIEDTVTPTGSNDYFFHVENDSSDPLVIDRIAFDPAGAEVIYVEVGASYTVGGTSAAVDTALNRYVGGSSNAFTTKGTALAGVDITGQGTTYIIHQLDTAAGTPVVLDWHNRPVVLGANQVLLLKAGTGTAAITNICVDCHFVMEPKLDA